MKPKFHFSGLVVLIAAYFLSAVVLLAASLWCLLRLYALAHLGSCRDTISLFHEDFMCRLPDVLIILFVSLFFSSVLSFFWGIKKSLLLKTCSLPFNRKPMKSAFYFFCSVVFIVACFLISVVLLGISLWYLGSGLHELDYFNSDFCRNHECALPYREILFSVYLLLIAVPPFYWGIRKLGFLKTCSFPSEIQLILSPGNAGRASDNVSE